MMTSRQAYWRLSLVLLIFGCLALAHSIWLPLHKAPDEQAHFRYVQFIARTGHLPRNFEEREIASYKSNQPALYHELNALLTGWSDSDDPPYLKFVWHSPRFELAQELLDTKRLANTEDEFMPYQGVILMWHLARLVSIFLSMGTIVLAFFTTLEIFPENYWLALVSASIIAFVPIFIFVSSSVSDDPLVGLIVGLYFFFLVRIVKGDTRLRNFIGLGLSMGLAATSKNSTIILPVEVVGVFSYLAWQHPWGWLKWLKRVVVVAMVSIIASSWWYLTLIFYFNEIDTLGPVIGIYKPIFGSGINPTQRYVAYALTEGTAGGLDTLEFLREPWSAWSLYIYQSFWVNQIVNFPLGPMAQILIGVVCVIAIIGLIRVWRYQSDRRVWVGLFGFHLLLFLAFPTLRHYVQGNVSQTGQGRHVLFPIATMLPLLLTYGWQGWFSPKIQRRLALVVVGGLLCWSLAQLIRVIDYPLYFLPIRTTAEVASQIPHRLDQPFGENLVLFGHDIEIDPTVSAMKIKLYWQSPAYPDEDYLMNIGLLQDGIPKLSWSSYPINGRYPTRIWENWEIIRDDIWLPLIDVPPGDYELQLQLSSSLNPLSVGSKEVLTLDQVTIPAVSPVQPQIKFKTHVDGRELVTGVTLWHADRYRILDLPEYNPRMQIPFVWQGQPAADERVEWLLVGPDGQVYPSEPISEHFRYFPVGIDWPSGEYRLRTELWRGDQVMASQESEPIVTIVNKKPRLLDPPPIAYPMDANFDNQIKLLGYDLPERSLAAGQGIPLILVWRGLRTMGQSYTVFTKLFDNQQQLWGSTERLPADGYSTFHWLENEVVIDGFELPVKSDIPPGIYWLNVGLYEDINNNAVSLPLAIDGAQSEVTSVNIGPVKIGGPPPGVLFSAQEINPKEKLKIELGEPPVILLHGYDITQEADTMQLTLYWESMAKTSSDWSIFVHLQNEAGETIVQKDGPAGGATTYPTSLWDPGEILADEVIIPIPEGLSPGQYSLVVGLYNLVDGGRLAVPESTNNEIILTSWERTRP